MTMLSGAGALFVFALFSGEWTHLGSYHVTLRSVEALVYLIIFGTLIAFSSYIWLLRSAPILVVGSQSYVTPLVAVALGAFVAGEQISQVAILAGAVILSSVVIIALAPALQPKVLVPAEP